MKAIIITLSVFLVMFIGTMGYIIGLSQGLDKTIEDFKYAGYESDDTHYVNGQILLPDMVHLDTLVVINSEYLNECLARPDVGSDGDIMEILNETCVKYTINPHEYQIDITEDSTYIYDGNRYVGSIPYDSTQQFDKVMLRDNL